MLFRSQDSLGYNGESVLCVKSNGTLWAWGRNDVGQLGINNTTNISSPTQVGTDTNWLKASTQYGMSRRCSAAIKSDGSLWTWGQNTYGELGIGNTIDKSSPVQVGTDTNWNKVSSGGVNTIAIKTDGTLWVWGNNTYGQLGLGNTTGYSSPKQVGALTNWLTASAGAYFIASLKTNNSLWTWGRSEEHTSELQSH